MERRTQGSHFITPAKRGNQVILDSALKTGPQLSSVVITSSAAAVFDASKPVGTVFTESDFATSALERAEKDKAEGLKTPPGVLYSASKAAAEKEVWRWRDEHKVNLISLLFL